MASIAAASKNVELMQLLLQNDPKSELLSPLPHEYYFPLIEAVRSEDVEMVKLILNHPGNLAHLHDARSAAIRQGDTGMLRLLIQYEALPKRTQFSFQQDHLAFVLSQGINVQPTSV